MTPRRRDAWCSWCHNLLPAHQPGCPCAIACGTCGAPEGRRCLTARWTIRAQPHTSRRDEAWELAELTEAIEVRRYLARKQTAANAAAIRWAITHGTPEGQLAIFDGNKEDVPA
jgi:hypothetical protein